MIGGNGRSERTKCGRHECELARLKLDARVSHARRFCREGANPSLPMSMQS